VYVPGFPLWVHIQKGNGVWVHIHLCVFRAFRFLSAAFLLYLAIGQQVHLPVRKTETDK
jgi:hypothetical protein